MYNNFHLCLGGALLHYNCPKCMEMYTRSIEKLTGQESELERLVRVANEGREAELKLFKNHWDKVEYLSETCDKWFLNNVMYFINSKYRIKLKDRPLPTPIYVSLGKGFRGEGWKVELSKDRKTVQVGCESFYANALKEAIQLCAKYGGHTDLQNGTLRTTRTGLLYEVRGNYQISWADADRLLAYLEEGLK